jgi:hypothetical protein
VDEMREDGLFAIFIRCLLCDVLMAKIVGCFVGWFGLCLARKRAAILGRFWVLKEVEIYGDFWVSVISALFYFVRLTPAFTTSPWFLSSFVVVYFIGLVRSQERLQAMVCVCARGRDKDVLCM